MIRFRINELIEECNRDRRDDNRLHMQVVADAVGVKRSTLAGLTTFTREPVTNSATIEALCRFFRLHHPRFNVAALFEFDPPLQDTTEVHVDRLYPRRLAKRRDYERNLRRRGRG